MGAVISWQRHINANVGRSDASICPPRTCVRDAGSSNQVTHSTVCADLSVVAAGLPSDCIVLLDALVEGARNEEYVFGSGRSRGGGPRLVQSLARRVHGRSLSSRARPAGARFVALTRRATPPFDVAMLEVDPLGAVHDCEAVAIGNDAERLLGNYSVSTPISDMHSSDVLAFLAYVLRNASRICSSMPEGGPASAGSDDLEFSVTVMSHRGPPTVLRGLRLRHLDMRSDAAADLGSGGKVDISVTTGGSCDSHSDGADAEVAAALRAVRRAVLRAMQRASAKAMN